MYIAKDDIPTVEMLPGVRRRTLAAGERAMICEISLDPGAMVPTHSHPHEQVGTVLKGAIRMVIGGEERICRAGDAYVVPPDVEHLGQALDEGAVVLDVFSPPREEYR